jgi:hypothetical protein
LPENRPVTLDIQLGCEVHRAHQLTTVFSSCIKPKRDLQQEVHYLQVGWPGSLFARPQSL